MHHASSWQADRVVRQHQRRHMISESIHQVMTGVIRRQYNCAREDLAAQLLALGDPGGDLVPVIEGLCAHQLHAGIVQDDLHALERFQITAPRDPSHVFYVDYNPARARRHYGAGRAEAPPGWARVHGGCYLCPENILWQQRFCQFPVQVLLPSGAYHAWANPFPLGHFHVTIAAGAHVPQAWMAHDRAESLHSLERRIVDLVHLAQQLPRYLVFENGAGAGATLPQHHHFQALKKWPGLVRYPIEAAARVQEECDGVGKEGQSFVLRDYPVAALCWHGTGEEISTSIETSLSGWLGGLGAEGDWRHLTTNLIATRESPADARIRLFVIPRNTHITRATGLAGAVASLELAGELVFAHEQERDRIAAGQVSYDSVWETLASAQDAGSRALLETE